MRIVISNSRNAEVAAILVEGGRVAVEGHFPGGLTAEDLGSLGFVYYETDDRGDIVARLQEVPPSECLNYVRAVQDALPPGYHVAHVESAVIEAERQSKRQRFEEELQHITEEGQEPG